MSTTAPLSVRIATEATSGLVAAFARLIPQLSKSAPPPGRAELESMISSPVTDVLLACDARTGGGPKDEVDGDVVGALTLVVFRIPTGVRAWIEDVVVDDAARGRGAGELLNTYAIDLARAKGASTVDLTSRPSREAANRLYRRLGFVERETNVYRISLED